MAKLMPEPHPGRWYDSGPVMTVQQSFFEHLLACLANQKYINEVNADGMSEGIGEVRRIQRGIQQCIDDAYHHGWDLLMAAAPRPDPDEPPGTGSI